MKQKKNLLKTSIFIISFFTIVFLLGLNMIYSNEINLNEDSNISFFSVYHFMISLFIIVVLIISSHWLEKIVISKKLKIGIISIVLILYGIVQIFWIHETKGSQFADSQTVIQTAEEIFKGEKITNKDYIQYYPQQLNLVLVFVAIYKIFNSANIIILQYINVIANIFTVLGLYFITLKLSKNNKIQESMFFIMTLTFIPVIMLSMFVYGDFIGLAFATGSVYGIMCYTEKNRKIFFFFSMLAMAIACLFRMNYLIFAIAIGIYLIINFLEQEQKTMKSIFSMIVSIVILIIISILPGKMLASRLKNKYDLNTEKSVANIIYLYMGMSESTRANGWYNPEVHEIFTLSMKEGANQEEILEDKCYPKIKERIKYLLKHPRYTTKFYIDKTITIWTDPTMSLRFYNSVYPKEDSEYGIAEKILNGKGYENIKIYQKAIIILILSSTAIAIIMKMNRKKLDKQMLLLCLIFLGGFSFHLLWEAKARYVIPYIMIVIPVASIGIAEFLDKFILFLRETKQKNSG